MSSIERDFREDVYKFYVRPAMEGVAELCDYFEVDVVEKRELVSGAQEIAKKVFRSPPEKLDSESTFKAKYVGYAYFYRYTDEISQRKIASTGKISRPTLAKYNKALAEVEKDGYSG